EEDREVPMILGRPFLATGKALIDVEQGKLTLRVKDEHVIFDVYDDLKKSDDTTTCSKIDIVDEHLPKSVKEETGADTMESVLKDMDGWSDDEPEEDMMQQVPEIKTQYFEELGTSEKMPIRALTQNPVLELKPLSNHLKYAYLGTDHTLPIIISSSLT